MKVGAVSNFSFKSQNLKSDEIMNPYFYTYNDEYKPGYSFKEHKYQYLGGILALIAAGISLSKFAGRNSTPKSVVEIANKTLGLNKIKHSKRSITQIKEKIFYPIMSYINGEKRVMKGDFKTGLIIGGKNQEKLEEFVGAFMEHAKELNIHTIEINPLKSNKAKEVHKALDKAIDFYNQNNECVIVNIGDLTAVSKHSVSKTRCVSNIEERLSDMPKGVLWTAYTTKTDRLPYFYNNIPTLSVKIAD